MTILRPGLARLLAVCPPTAFPVVLVLALALAAPASAAPAPLQKTSLDSEAPPGAPPHWLPDEEWVMQHWLPYDERRLYALLRIDRGDVWQLLRDDTRSLADLAEARGWEPRALARRLVAPWRGKLREPRRLALLESRALRTLTQGHLAQHLFFHSLHQDAVPDAAPRIFGVASREEFATLRRSELSPLQICRLNGLSRGHAQAAAVATLEAKAAQAVRGQAMPAIQARRLLARQLRQVPRWLQQTRYNGPPPLTLPRGSVATAANYSNNPELSGDGRRVVYEGYEASLPTARSRGEISVLADDLDRGAGGAGGARRSAVRIRRPDPGVGPTPASGYNPAVSADGRWVAFESAEGNLNFAKRYGKMAIFVHDLRDGTTDEVSRDPGGAARSAYNPSVSGDGRRVAYESSSARGGRLEVFVFDRDAGRERRVPAPAGSTGTVHEPRLSADGRRLAFTALVAAGAGQRSAVFVRDLERGRTSRVSTPEEEAWEPALSADGRVVAYTASAAGATRVVLRTRGLAGGPVVAAPWPEGLAYEPSLSADGTRVAFVARLAGDRAAQVFVRDLTTGATQLASRADGPSGAPGAGAASHPALSGDGRRVAFTSEAWNLAGEKCNAARGIFVRDLATGRTALVSTGDGRNRYRGPTKGSSTARDARVALLCGRT